MQQDMQRDVAEVRAVARDAGNHDELVARLGRCRTVLIGEASHGSEEFYRERALITQRLVEEYGFGAVAIEGDWPDTRRVHLFATGRGHDQTAIEALDGFRRFPAWMWRNSAMLDFVGWLANHNSGLAPRERCGIHGLDLYSMHASAARVLAYLDSVDPAAAARARDHYECLDGTNPDPRRYAVEVMRGVRPGCRREVLFELVELTRARGRFVSGASSVLDADEDWFDAQQNARVVRGAEEYYRTMFRGSTESWNLRDRHMAETLVRLQQHLHRRGSNERTVVWAHNSHVGDARHTDMGRRGQVTLGQLVRAELGDECALVGQTTYHGTVTAATDWDRPAAYRRVRPALERSVEHLLHHAGHERLVLLPGELRRAACLDRMLLQRAIGVVYRPQTEFESHYFGAVPAQQFDALLHIDLTRAVEPIERVAPVAVDELDETYPFTT